MEIRHVVITPRTIRVYDNAEFVEKIWHDLKHAKGAGKDMFQSDDSIYKVHNETPDNISVRFEALMHTVQLDVRDRGVSLMSLKDISRPTPPQKKSKISPKQKRLF